jgi:hypothetical protein
MDLALPPPKRPFTIYGGLFTFDLDEVPIMGSSEAPYRIVSLFDYTCHHCRIMHGYLMQLNKLFSNQLAIISVPSPFDGACNFTVKRTPRVHTNACAYARLGLAVWRANRGAHPQFEEYLFAPETPPPLEEAFQYALKLAGPAALVKAADDPWVPRQLHQGISVYATNLTSLHNGALPQVIIGTNLVSGMISGLQDLLPHLERQFGLKPGG